MAKTKKEPKPIPARQEKGEDGSTSIARLAIAPTMQSAFTLKAYKTDLGDLELADLISVLREQTKAVNDGDMSRAESMLVSQAHTLDAIFNTMARQAALNLGHYLETVERYLKLALRAQSQSRATWETLSTIKHPPMANYVGQANVSNGHMQVNNGGTRAGKNGKTPNKLSGPGAVDEWLRHQMADTAGRTDKDMEAVGAVNGAEDSSR